MYDWIIMIEAIALSLIGGSVYIMLEHLNQTTKELQPVRYLGICIVAGLLAFASLGEPTNATAWQFIAAGVGAPAYVKRVLVPWWKT